MRARVRACARMRVCVRVRACVRLTASRPTLSERSTSTQRRNERSSDSCATPNRKTARSAYTSDDRGHPKDKARVLHVGASGEAMMVVVAAVSILSPFIAWPAYACVRHGVPPQRHS
eukprot:1249008-Pleurochrysis_carterae.AAC.1